MRQIKEQKTRVGGGLRKRERGYQKRNNKEQGMRMVKVK